MVIGAFISAAKESDIDDLERKHPIASVDCSKLAIENASQGRLAPTDFENFGAEQFVVYRGRYEYPVHSNVHRQDPLAVPVGIIFRSIAEALRSPGLSSLEMFADGIYLPDSGDSQWTPRKGN